MITPTRYYAIIKAWGLTRNTGTVYVGPANEFVNVSNPEGKAPAELRKLLFDIGTTYGFDLTLLDPD